MLASIAKVIKSEPWAEDGRYLRQFLCGLATVAVIAGCLYLAIVLAVPVLFLMFYWYVPSFIAIPCFMLNMCFIREPRDKEWYVLGVLMGIFAVSSVIVPGFDI